MGVDFQAVVSGDETQMNDATCNGTDNDAYMVGTSARNVVDRGIGKPGKFIWRMRFGPDDKLFELRDSHGDSSDVSRGAYEKWLYWYRCCVDSGYARVI
jgi:hypothetical protein